MDIFSPLIKAYKFSDFFFIPNIAAEIKFF